MAALAQHRIEQPSNKMGSEGQPSGDRHAEDVVRKAQARFLPDVFPPSWRRTADGSDDVRAGSPETPSVH